jgi:D-alanine-D-alanine ligase
MLPARCVILVNADFESRSAEPEATGPRAYAADAAVLVTASAVGEALRELGVAVEELRVTSSLRGLARALELRRPDVVFNLVESVANDYGREWEVAWLLARRGFAYTGNAAPPLRLCRAKDRVRRVLARAGARVAPGVVLHSADPAVVRSTVTRAALAFPAFVKPARVDGSIGVDADSLVHDIAALTARLAKLTASRVPGPFLVEEFLPGRELNVALVPGPDALLAAPTEIDFSACAADCPRFITFASKWDPTSPEYASRSLPAHLEPALAAEVDALARRAFTALGGSGYGRVDLRLDRLGRPCVIDVNPNSDIHPDAGLATAARSVGLAYPALLVRILEHAQRRRHDKTTAEVPRARPSRRRD